MQNTRSIKYNIEVDEKGAIKSINRVGKEFDELEKDSARAAKGVTRSWSTAFGSISKLIVGGALIVGFKSIIKSASDLEESYNKVFALFGSEQAQSIDKWARGAARSMGLARQEALDAIGTMGNMFLQLGATAGEAAGFSRELVKLSADITSYHNVAGGAVKVLEDMASAFRGEYDPIQKYIPLINAATVETQALAETGKKTAKELTALEKAMAAQTLIMQGAGAATGDFEKTSKSTANQIRIMEANVQNLSGKMGENLLPIVETLLTTFNDMIEDGGTLSGVLNFLAGNIDKLTYALLAFAAARTALFLTSLIGDMYNLGKTIISVTGYWYKHRQIMTIMEALYAQTGIRVTALNTAVFGIVGILATVGVAIFNYHKRIRELNVDLEKATMLEKQNALAIVEKQITALQASIQDYEKYIALGYKLTEVQEKELKYYRESTKAALERKAAIESSIKTELTPPGILDPGGAPPPGGDGGGGGGKDDKIDEVKDKWVNPYLELANQLADEEKTILTNQNQWKMDASNEFYARQLEQQEMYRQAVIDKEQMFFEQRREEMMKEQEFLTSIGTKTTDVFMNGFDVILEGNENMAESFKLMAASILKDISRMIMRMLVMKAVMSMLGMFGGGAMRGPHVNQDPGGVTTAFGLASGGVLMNGNIVPFANGGIVSRPTLFPMAKGGVGLMGEAGPEAVMPLKRGKGGKLGVAADGAGINISNNIVIENGGQMAEDPEKMNRFAAKIGEEIRNQVRSVIMDEQRVNGVLNSAALRRYA